MEFVNRARFRMRTPVTIRTLLLLKRGPKLEMYAGKVYLSLKLTVPSASCLTNAGRTHKLLPTPLQLHTCYI